MLTATIVKNNPRAVTKTLDFIVSAVSRKDASSEVIVEGYANTSSKDRVGDVVLPAAFEKSLATFLKNPVLLANHDWNDPCGRVLEAKITDKGLYIKARISDTREDIKTLIREGCLSTFSIGYNEIDADYDESTKTKYVKELELLEISVVTVPANTEASFTVATQKVDEPADEGQKAEPETGKAAPAMAVVKTAAQLKDFINCVKSVIGNEITGEQVIGICDYFNSNEEIMTKEQLIALLRTKSALPAAATPAAEDTKTDEAAPAAAQPDAMEFMKQVMAKLDAIGQALAQIMEAKPAEEQAAADQPAEEGKGDEADAKPAEEAAAASEDKDEDELSEEELEKQLAEVGEAIESLEDESNA